MCWYKRAAAAGNELTAFALHRFGEYEAKTAAEAKFAAEAQVAAEYKTKAISLWRCLTPKGVAYRNSQNFHDRCHDFDGPSQGETVRAVGYEPGSKWLKIELVSHGTKYLPIAAVSQVFFERA